MLRFSFPLVLAFILTTAHPLSAHVPGHHEHKHKHEHSHGDCHGCEVKFSEDDDKQVRAIKRLLHVLHHAIEGEHIHFRSVSEFFQAFRTKELWLKTLAQFKPSSIENMVLRTTRAFNMEAEKADIRNHVKNLAFLFPLSHGIEMAASPVFIYMGTVNGWPAIVTGVGGSLISLISIPGLDPLCAIIMASYPLKVVHRSVDRVRAPVSYTHLTLPTKA